MIQIIYSKSSEKKKKKKEKEKHILSAFLQPTHAIHFRVLDREIFRAAKTFLILGCFLVLLYSCTNKESIFHKP